MKNLPGTRPRQSDASHLRFLKNEILEISKQTKRGFAASFRDQERARELIFELAKYNPTPEPATPYYPNAPTDFVTSGTTLAGKWTLVYTDAPDITGLESPQQQRGFLSLPATANLGRIGQECVPPLIQNVIEWQRPEWASDLPLFSGYTRILQKVLTQASVDPSPCWFI
jgi:hypothetical protein